MQDSNLQNSSELKDECGYDDGLAQDSINSNEELMDLLKNDELFVKGFGKWRGNVRENLLNAENQK